MTYAGSSLATAEEGGIAGTSPMSETPYSLGLWAFQMLALLVIARPYRLSKEECLGVVGLRARSKIWLRGWRRRPRQSMVGFRDAGMTIGAIGLNAFYTFANAFSFPSEWTSPGSFHYFASVVAGVAVIVLSVLHIRRPVD